MRRMIFLLFILLVSQTIFAHTNTSVSPMDFLKEEILKIEITDQIKELRPASVETYVGDVIILDGDLTGRSIAELMTMDIIELPTGDIIYPEEIEFAILKKYPKPFLIAKIPCDD